MALLEIVLYPDSVLREECKDVEQFDDELRTLLDDMAETMYAAPGIGLAAPQVGRTCRAIVIDVGDDPESGRGGELLKLVNPEIVKRSGEIEWEEGCLSIPGITERVKRAELVTVAAKNENGEPFEIEASGILSVCIQHEIDHIDGVLFIDHLSRLKQQLIKKKLASVGNTRE